MHLTYREFIETHKLKKAFWGLEKVQLQGVHRTTSCMQFSNAQLSKLAGISFTACVASLCISILVSVFQVPRTLMRITSYICLLCALLLCEHFWS